MISPYEFRGSWSGYERDVFFHNPDGPGRFYQAAYGLGLDFADDGRAIVPVDIDGDGGLDIAFASLQTLRLMKNYGPGRSAHFIRIEVLAEEGVNPALGTIVKVRTGSRTQQDYVKLTAGFQAQVPSQLHFGLGESQTIDALEVLWPDGTSQSFTGLAVNKVYRIRRGQKEVKPVSLPAWPSTEALVAPVDSEGLLLARAKGVDGGLARLQSPNRKMTVVNFWAPWCKPCSKELPLLGRLSKKYADSFDWIGVSVETEKRDSVLESIKKYKLSYRQVYSNDDLLARFFGDDGQMPLPATFIFDESGHLLRAYYRPVQQKSFEKQLLSLVGEAKNSDLLIKLGEAHFLRGENDLAENAFRQALKTSPRSSAALYGLAATMRNFGDGEQARKLIKKALKYDPRSAYGWWLLGLTESQDGDEKAAGRALKKAVEINSESVRYVMSLASHEFRANKLTEAAQLYEAVLKLDPKSVKAWLNLAKVRMSMRNPAALDAVEEALKLQPKNRNALRMRTDLKKILGR